MCLRIEWIIQYSNMEKYVMLHIYTCYAWEIGTYDVRYNKVTLFEIGWLYVRVDREAYAFVFISVLITEMPVIVANTLFMLPLKENAEKYIRYYSWKCAEFRLISFIIFFKNH